MAPAVKSDTPALQAPPANALPPTFGDVPEGKQFSFQGRTYEKRSGDRRMGGLAECQTDRSLDQVFFDMATIDRVLN